MKRIARSLHILWRAESQLGATRAAALMKKTGMLAFAALIGVFGVAMLDVAAFFSLAVHWDYTGAALMVAIGDFVLAIVVLVLANFVQPAGAELDLLGEIRDMALEDLETEFAGAETAFVHTRNELLAMIRHPLSSLAPGILLPFLKSILSGLRQDPEHK